MRLDTSTRVSVLVAATVLGQDSVQGTAPGISGRRKLNKFSYDGDVVLRYPAAVGSRSG